MSVFILDSGLAPNDLLGGLGEAFRIEVQVNPKELLTYQDTFDWRLHRAGLSLATSPSGRQTRVSLRARDGQGLDSVAPRVPRFASDLPPGPFRERLHPIANHRRFLPKGRAEWRRTLVAILNEDGKTVVRLLLRQGEALPSDGRGPIPLQPRLETLPLKGYLSEEKKVIAFLRKAHPLKRDSRTELAVVCDALGLTPGDYSSSFDLALTPRMPATKAVKEIYRTLFESMLANQEGVAKDWDSEFLHDFRVAVRRTRSALSQLKGMVPGAEVDYFLEEFRWLGSRTGPSRDIDVYLLKIPAYRAALHPGARKDLEPLVRLLREKKRVEHRRLLAAFRSARFHSLMENWQVFLETPDDPGPGLPEALRPIREVASERIWKGFNKVIRKGGDISRNSPAEALHRLRIECKKLRYLITFFRSLYPDEEIVPLIKELKGLQDHLGDFNDLQVQGKTLGSFAEEMMATEAGPPATLLAMGQLMGQLEGKQIQERESFHQHLKRFLGPKNRRHFRRLFGPLPRTDPQPPKGEGTS